MSTATRQLGRSSVTPVDRNSPLPDQECWPAPLPLRGILLLRRCAVFSSGAAVRPSYPPPLPPSFDPPPLAINRAPRPRDPPTPRPHVRAATPSPPRSSAADGRPPLRRRRARWSLRDPPPPLLGRLTPPAARFASSS
ncbi:hypothetical protein Scep_007338 [Stephania cephalantha]|uniref:Uncharacterized protein n=1 Tax=Stephania cephalantha TaxID=152367 RepID=A0AAP0K9N4_9MAGN